MTTADSQMQSSQRFYDLDALRALAMFLGIVLHSTLFVLPEPVSLWPLHDKNAEGDFTYRVIIDAIHGFRMPVFFMLSGFFSALLWQRRGLNSLAMQRIKRVGIPLIVACLTVLPVSVAVLALAAGRVDPYDFPLWVLPFVWVQNLGHLWFLWHLLLITAGFILLSSRGIQFHSFAWWLLLPASALLSLVMIEPVFGSDTAEGLIPEPAVIFYYACFFLFGVFFYQRGISVRRWWAVALLPSIAAFVAADYLLDRYIEEVGSDPPEAFLFESPLTMASALIEAAYAWLMAFGMVGLFRLIASRESFTMRYLSDAAYWMYLSHAPLVVLGQWLVLDWPISHHLKFLFVCAGVTAIVLFTYQYGVRYTFIGRALNGPRTPRAASGPGSSALAPRES